MIPSNPEMLYSYLNLQLRDKYASLEALCEDLDISQTEIEEKMAAAGYVYQKEGNRFAAQ